MHRRSSAPLYRLSLASFAAAAILFANSDLSAASAIVPTIPSEEDAPIGLLVDLSTGQTLFAREAERRFAPASITKVMSAYTAFQLLSKDRLDLSQVMTVRPETFDKWSRVGSTMFLPRDAQVTVGQLLMGVTAVSANDGAAVLAEGAAGSVDNWVALMNANARRLGMRDSHFATPNGWPDGGATYTSARDLVKLASATISEHPNLYTAFFGKPGFSYGGITQRNHDPISGVVQGADGLKTGYTDQAGYTFLGSAERDGRRLVMVVAASDTARARDRASRSLMEWGFAAFDHHKLLPVDHAVAMAQVQNGSKTEVALVADGPLSVTVPRGTRPAVAMSVHYDGPIRAPVEAGETLGRLHVAIEGMPSYSIPLKAGERVEKAGPLLRVRNGILGWFS